MFSSGSPYSPFFTSGLFVASAVPDDTPASPRRGSLPTDSLSTRTPAPPTAAYYATQKEYRSFLSLDLAESRKSKQSTPAQPLRLRYSRDSIRSIPSPKPAPSITLPELPVPKAPTPVPVASAPPRLPSIPKLPSLRISRTEAPTTVVSLKKSRFSTTTTSTVSTRARKINRSNALDRLEGKIKLQASAPPSISRFSLRRNFMSLSDDESDDDEEDSDIDSLDAKSDYSDDFFETQDNRLFYTGYFEPEDLVFPSAKSASTSPTRSATAPSSPKSSPSSPNKHASSSPSRKQFIRRSTKDWFPLKSFIDLRNGNDGDSSSFASGPTSTSAASPTTSSWSWRSFIDVAHLP
ncbi:hypothetical protein EST38_g1957 [Candolleomyces aberdarensis]|uniref:Uncharacterized protein n=1 Tax=Candolleomyces aberdarensis TaxID=2316362 RepID=A0A4Q2DVW1_9AGAR|nr:hypothetical protein EST38_g1957 [Candolleomyces aberdarensis]